MEAPFGGPLQSALIGRTFLEGPLFVHSFANKGPLCGGPFMGSTYRGPICKGRMRNFAEAFVGGIYGSPMKKTHLRS